MTFSKNTGKVLMVMSAFLVSLGQLMWKFSGTSINIHLFLGFLFYGCGFLCMVISFKTDELSKLYPFMSLSYIFATIYSTVLLKDPLSFNGILGVMFICLGVFFLGSDKS